MKKLYYSIGELSKLTDVEAHVLRYWETVFDSLNPQKNRAGKRIYTEKDIETVLQLRELIIEKKYSTAGAKKALRMQNKEQNDSEKIPVAVEKDLRQTKRLLEEILTQL